MAPGSLFLQVAAITLLLAVLPVISAHNHEAHDGMTIKPSVAAIEAAQPSTVDLDSPKASGSYFRLHENTGWIYAHIVFMIVAWFFVLPIEVMLSLARSNLTFPTQLIFLGTNAIGLILGTVYNARTDDMYPNNAHHKIGWIITWIVGAQGFVSLIQLYSGHFSVRRGDMVLGYSALGLRGAHGSTQFKLSEMEEDPNRFSQDSGQGEESALYSPRGSSLSGVAEHASWQPQDYSGIEDVEHGSDFDAAEKSTLLQGTRIDSWILRKIPSRISSRTVRYLGYASAVIDRVSLMFGFLAITTGIVTYTGIFQGSSIFNGLAHFIKGAIFFWYGLLTLGRWMGCFADFGWAWNIKPLASTVGVMKARIPSAEFVESFVMFLYGCSNVFLEHLAAWGSAWTAQDLEHVSISVMFFGGGLCGMLIESSKIRNLLNATILVSSARKSAESPPPPRSYNFSMNPLPALIFLLLGTMMGSHHQASMTSTMVHKQWGTLLVGFSLARAVTYVLFYISQPASILSSRPPSELISSFCLISGGLIFMASNRDTIQGMDHYGLDAMFTFTVTMGFTAFLMAWTIIVIAIKGWAVQRKALSGPGAP